MNTDNVEQQVPEQQKPEQQVLEQQKPKLEPKHNCKKCHGTGRIGFINGDFNNPMICQCVINNAKKLKLHQWADKQDVRVEGQ